jgi:uncharacterized small protein (DUF1192 family)
MNSFKKIAVVTAAAMALVGLSTSANAAPLAVNVGIVANATTAVAPATVAVPSTNIIDAGHSVAITATADTGTTVTFAANGVKFVTALNTADAPKTIASGTSSLSIVSTGASVTVHAYTTTTSVGSVTVNNGAYSTIVYIQGIAAGASKIALSVPSSVAVGTVPTISASATDVFGNPVGGESILVTLIGSTFAGGSVTSTIVTSSVTSAAGVTPATVLGKGDAALSTAVAGEITAVATGANSAVAVIGLDAPVKSAIAKFTVSDLNAQIANLKAELASVNALLGAEKAGRVADKAAADKALADAKIASDKVLADANTASAAALATAKASSDAAAAIAAKTYKAQYNALAKKWNAKHPTLKVALLK